MRSYDSTFTLISPSIIAIFSIESKPLLISSGPFLPSNDPTQSSESLLFHRYEGKKWIVPLNDQAILYEDAGSDFSFQRRLRPIEDVADPKIHH